MLKSFFRILFIPSVFFIFLLIPLFSTYKYVKSLGRIIEICDKIIPENDIPEAINERINDRSGGVVPTDNLSSIVEPLIIPIERLASHPLVPENIIFYDLSIKNNTTYFVKTIDEHITSTLKFELNGKIFNIEHGSTMLINDGPIVLSSLAEFTSNTLYSIFLSPYSSSTLTLPRSLLGQETPEVGQRYGFSNEDIERNLCIIISIKLDHFSFWSTIIVFPPAVFSVILAGFLALKSVPAKILKKGYKGFFLDD